MKTISTKIIFFTFFLFALSIGHSQVFWSEDFGSGCNSGRIAPSYSSPNGSWTINNTGANGASANEWYISASEAGGQVSGSCGATLCTQLNNSLHIGGQNNFVTNADSEAEYAESDFVFSFFGAILLDFRSNTDKRVESPVIDCSGNSNIELSFDYLEYGDGSGDNGELWYYDGISWSLLVDLNRTTDATCTRNSSWSTFQTFLPSSADNNPNVQIGFRWYNDFSNPNNSFKSIAIDAIELSVPVNPIVQFSHSEIMVSEADLGYTLMVDLANPDATNPTSVDVVMVSPDPNSRLTYTNTTITFPAGSSASIPVFVGINNNTDCEEDEHFVFELHNLTGLASPLYGFHTSFNLGLIDDDRIVRTSFEEGFESGTPSLIPWRSPNLDWAVSSSGSIHGAFSMVYDANLSGTAVRSFANSLNRRYYSNDKIQGVKTRWRFNVEYPTDPDPSNLLHIALTNERKSGLDNGYRLIIADPGTGIDMIVITRVENGVVQASPFSGVDPMVFGSEIGTWNTSMPIGIEVLRDEFGNWNIAMDSDGDGIFNSLIALPLNTTVPHAGGFDDVFSHMGEFAIGLEHNSLATGRLRVDDISVEIKGCIDTYYSQSSGNLKDPIWDKIPLGTAGPISPNQFSIYQIQNTHSVVQNSNDCMHRLDINSGGEYILMDDMELDIFGDFIVNGDFHPNKGIVSFTGHHAQSIDGTSGNEIPFYTMNILNDSPDDIVAYKDLAIKHRINPKLGVLDMNGNIIHLESDPTLGTGGIGEISPGSDVIGNIKLDRHILADTGSDPYPGGWVAIGTPVNGVTVADWNSSLTTTGFPGSDYPDYLYGDGTAFNNVIYWDPYSSIYKGVSDLNESLSNTDGYFVYMNASGQNTSLTGSFDKGNFSQSLAFTGTGSGWNLVVNPYPCEIDWVALFSNSVNLSPVITVYDSDTDTYQTYDAVSGLGSASQYIASSQAFWVRGTSASATLSYSEDVKSDAGAYGFEREFTSNNGLNISLSTEYQTDNSYVGINENASETFDEGIDGKKFDIPLPGNNQLGVCTLSEDQVKLSFNYYPNLQNDIEIPVSIQTPYEGEFTIEVSMDEEFANNSCMVLHDLLTDELLPITDDFIYSFESEMVNEVRFVLKMAAQVSIEYTDVSCFEENNGTVSAFLISETPVSYIWYDESDNQIAQHNNITEPSILENLSYGNYLVEVITENSICNTRTELIYIDQPHEEVFSFESQKSNCEQNQLGKLIFNGQEMDQAYSYQIFKNNQQIDGGEITGYLLKEFEGAEYSVHIQTACNSYVYDVDLKDVNIPVLELNTHITELFFDGSPILGSYSVSGENVDHLIWMIDGVIMGEDEIFTYEFIEEGEYEITVIGLSETGSCSDSKTTTVTVSSSVSVESLDTSYDLTVNLSGSKLEINPGMLLTNGNIQIINSIGQIVIDHTVFDKKGLITEELSQLKSGVYIVRILNENQQIYSSKIVK